MEDGAMLMAVDRLGPSTAGALSHDEWIAVGQQIARAERAVQWVIGDWWNAGEPWGDRVEVAGQLFPFLAPQTIRLYGMIASRYAPLKRFNKLAWSHHLKAVDLDPEERERVLTLAEAEQWSARDVEAEVCRIRFGPIKELPAHTEDILQTHVMAAIEAWNHASMPARQIIASLIVEAEWSEIDRQDFVAVKDELPLQSLSTPEMLARVTGAPVRVCKLVFAVADNDEANMRLIRGPSMDEETLRQRRAVILVAKLHTQATLSEIGRAVGRDHSVVLRGLEQAKRMWIEDADFRALCGRITTVIGPERVQRSALAA